MMCTKVWMQLERVKIGGRYNSYLFCLTRNVYIYIFFFKILVDRMENVSVG